MDQDSYNQFYDQEYRYIYGGEKGPSEVFFNDQYVRLGKKIYEFVRKASKSETLNGKFVLEVGCGAGGILKYFKDQGCIIKGIDLGSQYIEYGRDIHGLDLAVMDISKLKIKNAPDVIIYSHVLEHILDLKSQLECIRDLMHEDTMLYIEVPGLRNLHRSYSNDLLLYLQNAHVYHFTKTSLQNLMQSNGFSGVVIDEYVRSIFKKSLVRSGFAYNNECPSVINYLRNVELMRRISPIPIYQLRFYIKRIIYNILAFFKVIPDRYRKLN